VEIKGGEVLEALVEQIVGPQDQVGAIGEAVKLEPYPES